MDSDTAHGAPAIKTAADIYRFEVDPDSDTAAANVMRFVGRGKRILEIGAGPGSISRPLVEVNGCRMTALELDERSVAILRTFCELVVRCDLNDPAWPDALPSKDFDAVVIADVLEHLYDPWSTLKKAASLIRPGGSVIVSIPHASHASILACLMSDDFDYRDWGLLDRTHIRFFSMKNIQALFEGAGLKIADVAHVVRRPEETEFAEVWQRLSPRVRAVLEAGDYADVYQVVVRAVRTDDPSTPGLSLMTTRAPQANRLKYIAFYLPQFHPIPENDLWWGKGFTEWTNVTKAQPLFEGHYQPHLPTELGFYDLRVRDVQREQADLARSHGIDSFCFHYYWFGGRRLLERPLDAFLADPQSLIEFCLCWANENWSRRWDAAEQEILVAQTYTPENDIAFAESLLPYFRDPRYTRVDGAPVLVIYRPQHMPDPKATAVRWRKHFREAGVGEVHLVAALTHGNEDYEQFGFDAGVEFPPHNLHAANIKDDVETTIPLSGHIVEQAAIATHALAQDYSGRRVYRSVFPSWDNTARRHERALIVVGSTPANYERWLDQASHRTVQERTPSERLVFVNAWNEWAEGCHLEPDRRFGRAYLEATLRAKSGKSDPDAPFVVSPLSNGRHFPASGPAKDPRDQTPAERLGYTGPGLKAEIAMWAARKLVDRPRLYRGGRAIYRKLRPPRVSS